MSVHRRDYRPYTGALTPARLRYWVVLRYGLSDLLVSRALLAFLFVATIPMLAEAVIIYLAHHPSARLLLGLVKLDEFIRIDRAFFLSAQSTHCFFGLILTAWVAPTLIAGDLANGALPLYLSRPFSRLEYLIGKALVLIVLLSSMTWLPSLLLYCINAALSDGGWGWSNLHLLMGSFVGSWAWIGVMTMLGLAISAWLKWRLAASAMLFGIHFVSAGLAELVAVLFKNASGKILSLGHLFEVTWGQLFGSPNLDRSISPTAAWLALGGWCLFALVTLQRRLRAREAVR